MSKTKSEFDSIQVDGVVDVGIIVIAHFSNPIQQKMVQFIRDIIQGKKNIVIPLTTFIGAYHILTRYLGVSRYQAKTALISTLNLESSLFYPRIDTGIIINALDISSVYNIESWDGYLFALATLFRTNHIYTIDKKLQKVQDYEIICPVSEDEMNTYHSWLMEKLKMK